MDSVSILWDVAVCARASASLRNATRPHTVKDGNVQMYLQGSIGSYGRGRRRRKRRKGRAFDDGQRVRLGVEYKIVESNQRARREEEVPARARTVSELSGADTVKGRSPVNGLGRGCLGLVST